MNVLNYSIHFHTKNQKPKEIEYALHNWTSEVGNVIGRFFDLLPPSNITLHHCFLARDQVTDNLPKIVTDTLDFLETLDENTIHWNRVADDLGMCRFFMLKNLRQLNGVAIFIGSIEHGVKDEYDLAKQIGVDIVHIPLNAKKS